MDLRKGVGELWEEKEKGFFLFGPRGDLRGTRYGIVHPNLQ